MCNTTRCGFLNPQVSTKPLPQPVKYLYPWCGYGFTGVGVRVVLEYPRVTRDNH